MVDLEPEPAEQRLGAAPVGTYVQTDNGCGGALFDDYEVVRAYKELPCPLRLARKRRACNH